jgi:arylsulfatase A
MDLTATVLAATSTPVPPDARLDGIDLLPILRRQSQMVERTLFFRLINARRHQRVVRQGDWKLMIDGGEIPGAPVPAPTLLFNLRDDVSERTDLAKQHPDIVRRLRGRLAQWERDVDGQSLTSDR